MWGVIEAIKVEIPTLAEKAVKAAWWDGFRTGVFLAAIVILVVFSARRQSR